MVRSRFGFRGHGYGFGLGLGITNSKKIKKMENLHMTSLYVAYNLKKIINMCFGGFCEKPFSEMSFDVRRFMVFD